MRVSVYHNVSPDFATRLIFGYEPGHPLVHVFDTHIENGEMTADELAEWIWTACNIDLDTDRHPDLLAVATAYRHCGLRSLSVGDVIGIGGRDDRTLLEVDNVGCSRIDGPLNIVTTHQYGTWPWTASARTATAWILRCWNEGEQDISVHSSQDDAIGELAAHVRSSWGPAASSGAVPGTPPASDKEAVSMYFGQALSDGPTPVGRLKGYSLSAIEVTSPPAAVPPELAAAHPNLALDLATADGRAIYDLFIRMARNESREWPEIARILADWFGSCGVPCAAPRTHDQSGRTSHLPPAHDGQGGRGVAGLSR
jgi:hypothetical protein